MAPSRSFKSVKPACRKLGWEEVHGAGQGCQHPCRMRRYQEKFYFNPGDTGFKVFRTRFATIGVAVCWDQWFPEAARCMALQGAEVTLWPLH